MGNASFKQSLAWHLLQHHFHYALSKVNTTPLLSEVIDMDTLQSSKSLLSRVLGLVAMCALLSACGGGGGGGGGSESTASNTSTSSTSTSSTSSRSSISSGNVTLNWEAPLYREDGTPIHPDDIDTYTIKYKKVGEDSYQTLIASGDSDSIELNIDSPGVYEFIISATDESGAQSDYTSPIYGTIA